MLDSLGCRVQAVEFRASGLAFRLQGLKFKFRVEDSLLKTELQLPYWDRGLGFWV